MLSEQRRQAYLRAMGVECLVARMQLPGAAPSPVLDIEPVVVSSTAEMVPAAPSRNSAPEVRGAASAQSMFIDTAAARKPPSDRSEARGPRTEPSPTPRFSLSVVRAGAVLVIDERLPADSDVQEYLRFIRNILFAVGLGEGELSVDAFSWPLPGVRGGHVDLSEVAAREALTAYLSRVIEQSGVQYLLLMGGTASHFVAGEEQSRDGCFSHPAFLVQTLITGSACRAIADSSLKPALWRALQPLVQAIGSQ